jgi:Flp pilus assembly protein CpaB
LIIKTSFICFGIFILVASLCAWLIGANVALAREETAEVVLAGIRIESGSVITKGMLATKSIPLESKNKYMVERIEDVVGKKAGATIEAGDFIRDYAIMGRDNWYKEDDRITVLPMEVDERMANLIVRNSYIDIKTVPKVGKSLPKSVLSKVLVSDVIDENGVSLGENGVNKKAYVKVILSKDQRNRLYAARETGKLIYELYCDNSQKQPEEEFVIPLEFY